MSAITCMIGLERQPLATEYGPRMMESLSVYPADYVGTWQRDEAFLGCHGQWITPESLAERLPCEDGDTGLVITADAILDNRDELFEQLGVPVTGRAEMTDSRLLLLSYMKWGVQCPVHLVGDFAFIIWDPAEHALFGARDFSGSRTLYYSLTGELAAFCTTITPLLTLPGVDRSLSEQWISEFLAIPITTEAVDVSSTVYRNIRQVPPAHSFTLRGGRLAFNRYITIVPEEKLKLRSNEEYEEAFRDVFRRAVTSRLRTHREVGANLSGGLDSGSVVSFAARELKAQSKQLHTFSYVPVEDFADWTPRSRVANERAHIKETVSYVGNIRDQYFDFPEHSPYSEIDDWLDMLETPYKFYENSFWLKGIYEKAQAAGAGVLLTGSRGNWTISWGPAQDYQAGLLRNFKLLTLYREFNQYSANLNANRVKLRNVIGRKAFPALAQLFSRQRNEPVLPELIHPDFARRTQVFERLEQFGYDFWGDTSQDVYDVRRKQFEKLYYWSITGTVGCKQSLRHSLWERDATNDLRVIRFCLSVPENQYVQNGYGRSLIRRATKGYLPDSIRLNQRVRGIQGADGLYRMLPRWDALMNEFRETIEDPSVSELLNKESLRKAMAAIGDAPKPEIVFDTELRILMRALIFRRFLKRNA
ncbi:MAG: asparagine synthase [Paenibacillus sp.]|nr:asparagine synthase [Paenibacillus sp.]